MGKAAKKMVKNQRQRKADNEDTQITILKNEIIKLKNEKKYEEGLEKVIALMDLGYKDAGLMETTAEFYFMAMDYQRSAEWINRTLDVDSQNLEARILLARICVLGEQIEEGLGIIDIVLKIGENRLSKEQKQQLEEILEFYKITAADTIKAKYPHIKKFLNLVEDKCEQFSLASAAIQIKENLFINNIAEEKNCSKEIKSIATIKSEILQKQVSLQEKIRLCNFFAGGYYYDNTFKEADILLTMAVEFDQYDEMTLRNIALLKAEMKETEQALNYVSKLKTIDFSLLNFIKSRL